MYPRPRSIRSCPPNSKFARPIVSLLREVALRNISPATSEISALITSSPNRLTRWLNTGLTIDISTGSLPLAMATSTRLGSFSNCCSGPTGNSFRRTTLGQLAAGALSIPFGRRFSPVGSRLGENWMQIVLSIWPLSDARSSSLTCWYSLSGSLRDGSPAAMAPPSHYARVLLAGHLTRVIMSS